jgi:hypothetical protein
VAKCHPLSTTAPKTANAGASLFRNPLELDNARVIALHKYPDDKRIAIVLELFDLVHQLVNLHF